MNDLDTLMEGSWALLQINRRMLFFMRWRQRYPWKWRRVTFEADNGNMVTHVRFGIFHYCRIWWEKKETEAQDDQEDKFSNHYTGHFT